MEIDIKGFKVQIDEDDYERVMEHKWRPMWGKAKKEQLYYFRSLIWSEEAQKDKDTFLHRFLMGCVHGDGNIVDHKNHDTLDCRKENLRICTIQQNVQNSRVYKKKKDKYKGIKMEPSTGHWNARIQTPEQKRVDLGTYETAEEAAKAYDRASLYYFKEFAVTNFPKENYTEEDLQNINQSKPIPSKRNSSGYVGVTWNSPNKNWKARYISNGRTRWLGTYKTPYEAFIAREKYTAELKEKENV